MDLTKTNFDYSLKNIPIPTKDEYLKCLIHKVESFIKRLRWKVFYLDNDTNEDDNKETYGFKSEKVPPSNDALIPFENELYEMVRSIEFKNIKKEFLQNLTNDVKTVTSSPSILVPADKTTNMYKMSTADYKKILLNNITSTYTKTEESTLQNINEEAKTIATKLNLDDRIECFAQRNAFLTLKDHKENFPNKIKCRLINPAKPEIGKISKTILDKINKKLRRSTGLNQWGNTDSVISWFNKIDDKGNCKFFKFDITEFYPSISEKLLLNAIAFAKSYVDISEDSINIIIHSRKSILFHENQIWSKSSNPDFDVTMGSFDGAEVCELVGLFILNGLTAIFGKSNVGLYRDDGLAITRNSSGPEMEKIRKNIFQFFKEHELSVTSDCNLIQTDFLDVTFNLPKNAFWPFKKPNSSILYVNSDSNHPPSIKKQIPIMVENRLNRLSCNQQAFSTTLTPYQKALEKSGYKHNLTYKPEKKHRKKTRKRNITWFNPPFSENISTNIGKIFFKLIDRHFPPGHRLHKVCNRNNIKLSYSCMPNIKAIISKHNHNLLNTDTNLRTNQEKKCNCQNETNCPLNGKCLTKSIIYKATITTTEGKKEYIGSCETTFKTRFANHQHSFRNPKLKSATALSKEVWKNKESNHNYNITWSIIKQTSTYRCGGKRCNLCLEEKLAILKSNQQNSLNRKSEIISRCRHRSKFKLRRFKSTNFIQ